MSQHNEKNPHQHQSPLHDSSEAKPGMDSLAPEDGSHRPAAEPTPPGAQPTAPGSLKAPDTRNEKLNSLEDVRKGSENYALTTNQGVRIADDQNSLRAGNRGPTLLEDFILREKITHFDHERIPERIVHARGSAAHGYFQPYKSLSDITKADFLSDPNKITPVFVRFSTVQGGAGSADTVRDNSRRWKSGSRPVSFCASSQTSEALPASGFQWKRTNVAFPSALIRRKV